MEIVDKDMVSIVMLSHNGGKYVEESVRSVMVQTYSNWELLFLDDNSRDDTISVVSALMNEDRAMVSAKADSESTSKRIRVAKTLYQMGESTNMSSTLKNAKGRWIAFLNVGNVWAPDKLEKQVAFMKEHGYAFSYTSYGLMDMESRDRGVVVSGKAHVTHGDMLKCCWPAYMTVMYDREKVGEMKVRAPQNNDYALWLNVSDRHDCYLLDENLATMRTKWGRLGRILLTNNAKWRYDAYRIDEDLGRVTSLLYTIRNGWYGIVKWMKYVKRTK